MTTSPIRVVRVKDKRGLDLFVDFPYTLHRYEPMWVPPPRKSMRHLLDRQSHPFHEHASVDYFLAFRESKCVGRIAAIENHAHNEFHGERVAFFGFLDARAESDVFAALFARVEKWAAERKLDIVRGPCSPSTNEECGLLVQGFDTLPMVMTPWNPETIPPLIEELGYTKARDLISYASSFHNYNARMARLAELVKKKFERRGETIVCRPLNMQRFREELDIVREVYNAAWEKNWGFIPMTHKELTHMARELKPLVVPQLVRFVEINGKPAGFTFCLPDYNIPLRFMDGRMGPKQIALFLMLRPMIRQIRVLTMGVVGEFRNRGLEALLVDDIVETSRSLGYTLAELGWILEDNDLMNRELTGIGARHYRTHRIYEKKLT